MNINTQDQPPAMPTFESLPDFVDWATATLPPSAIEGLGTMKIADAFKEIARRVGWSGFNAEGLVYADVENFAAWWIREGRATYGPPTNERLAWPEIKWTDTPAAPMDITLAVDATASVKALDRVTQAVNAYSATLSKDTPPARSPRSRMITIACYVAGAVVTLSMVALIIHGEGWI